MYNIYSTYNVSWGAVVVLVPKLDVVVADEAGKLKVTAAVVVGAVEVAVEGAALATPSENPVEAGVVVAMPPSEKPLEDDVVVVGAALTENPVDAGVVADAPKLKPVAAGADDAAGAPNPRVGTATAEAAAEVAVLATGVAPNE